MAPPRMPEAVIGLDVGKLSHWACVATRDGEILLSAPVANREGDLDSLFGRFPDALVVVDQSRNIGALALARARAAGMSAAYLPGLAAHGAARLFAGDAKTDERDAMVIAKTALGIPDALLPVGDPGPTIAAARALAAQRNFLTCENTRNKNRLRSILLESCPAFEALVDLSDGPQLRLMASLGGAWSVADAGPRRAAALTRGAARGKIEALVRSTTSSTRPDASAPKLPLQIFLPRPSSRHRTCTSLCVSTPAMTVSPSIFAPLGLPPAPRPGLPDIALTGALQSSWLVRLSALMLLLGHGRTPGRGCRGETGRI